VRLDAVSSTSQAEPSQGLRLGLSAKDRGPAWLGWLVYQISIESAKNTDLILTRSGCLLMGVEFQV
jgi:hypothetical protein